MAKCTAPVYGHRTESGRLNCPVCGKSGRYSYSGSVSYPKNDYNPYYGSASTSSKSSHLSGNIGMSKRSATWSPAGSTVLYTSAQIRALEPIHKSILKQAERTEKKDIFLCHAWDDRKGFAKDLCKALEDKGVSVWFSEKDLKLGTTMLREIDKGLANSKAGIVLVTPAFLQRIKNEGIAEKELSALLAKDLLLPLVHGTTFEELRDVSPLLGSRSGLDTKEDNIDEIASKIAELFVNDELDEA